MKLEYFESDQLDKKTTKKLWRAGVCMDDWDFLIVTRELDKFEELEETDPYDDTKKIKVWTAKGWYLNRILETGGSYKYEWHKIQWKGRPAMLGITYHS